MNNGEKVSDNKLLWKKPELKKLGLMKDLVQEGNAFGKSGPDFDGMTSGTDEAMVM